METYTTKKGIIDKIGDWRTSQIDSNYLVGSNTIELSYKNEKVTFTSDNILEVAYIALECHAISNQQYTDIYRECKKGEF